jgi:hemerythrin
VALISWTPSMSVGIADIDDQHKKLIDLINQLHDAMRAGKGRLEILPTLESLVSYAETHFTAEEKVMERIGFPDLARHKVIHKNLTQRVQETLAQASQNQAGLSIQVINFLKDWLSNHILGEDIRYKPFAAQKGIH